MTPSTPTRPAKKTSEEGYILVAVMFMLAILMLSLAVAAPKIARSIQRDRELETIQRGKQYSRAIKRYYKQFGSYPPSIDALVKTNEIRFLRKRYLDPITGKDDWKPIPYGQQKTVSTGFFGQPLGAAGMAGAGMNGTPGAGGIGGSPTAGGSAFGGSTIGSGSTIGGGTSTIGGFGNGSSTNTTTGTTASGNGDAGGAGATDPGNPTTGTSSSSSSSAFSSTSGQTLGGMGIMGFSPASPKESILVFRKKKHYNEWEFLYDPLADQMMSGGNIGTIGTPVGGANPTGGAGSTIGSGSTIGGGTTSTPPTTTTPQQ